MAYVAPSIPAVGDLITAAQAAILAQNQIDAAAAWTTYTPVWTAVTTNPALGNGILTGQYLQVGKTVYYWLNLTCGSTTTFGSGIYSLTLPVACYAGATIFGYVRGFNSGVATFDGQAIRVTSTTVQIELPTSAASNAMVRLSNTVPWTIKAADTFMISGTYQAA